MRRYYGEKRAGADVVVVEGEPGAAIVVAAWMLDPAACAGMEIGAPHVSVEALVGSSSATEGTRTQRKLPRRRGRRPGGLQ